MSPPLKGGVKQWIRLRPCYSIQYALYCEHNAEQGLLLNETIQPTLQNGRQFSTLKQYVVQCDKVFTQY